jgi:hypothetical protein
VWGAAVGTIATIAVVGTKMKSYIFPPSVRDPPGMPFLHAIVARLLLRGAPGVRLEVHQIIVRGSDELNGAFATIARERADAVIIQGSLPVKLTVDLALKYQLPSLSTQKSAVQAGILMSYSASFAERGRVIANYVDQILKGAKPADLPVQQPTRYELAIYLAARGLFSSRRFTSRRTCEIMLGRAVSEGDAARPIAASHLRARTQ